MLEEATLSLPTVATVMVSGVVWAFSLAGVYYSLKARVVAVEMRMDRFREDLNRGSSQFSKFEERFSGIETTHKDYGERLVRLETLLGAMDDKLDNILVELKSAHK